jgi:hypothetical protein
VNAPEDRGQLRALRTARRAAARAERRRRYRAFLHRFRWSVYLAFVTFLVFMTVCMIWGIVANLDERYPELELPVASRSGVQPDPLQLRACLRALEILGEEERAQVHAAFTGELDRETFLARHRGWDRDWRARFADLGLSCRLSGADLTGQPALANLAELYRRVDYIQGQHVVLVRRYLTQNASMLREIRELGERAQQMLDGQLQDPPPPP